MSVPVSRRRENKLTVFLYVDKLVEHSLRKLENPRKLGARSRVIEHRDDRGLVSSREVLRCDHFLNDSGRSYMLVLPEKVKQTRREMAALARLARDGRMTISQVEESWRNRREHIAKGCSGRVLDSLDAYVSMLGIGDGDGNRD